MNKEELKKIIREMIRTGELNLDELTDVSLSKNALINHLEQAKQARSNKSYRTHGLYDSTNIKERKAFDEGYISACNTLIEYINRGDFNKEE